MRHTEENKTPSPHKLEPQRQFLLWFESIPPWQQRTLAHLHTMMTSPNTAYFTLDGDEALRHFLNVVRAPDFAVRQVANLLQVRSVFSFVFYDVEFVRRYTLDNPGLYGAAMTATPHYWDRCAASWHELCATGLSDAELHRWLMQQQG
ncbi:MAG: hypothetical protein PHH87_00480 [Desulfuromonas sp.]|nr:hypothetical protein [Desulfuromonas sp.]